MKLRIGLYLSFLATVFFSIPVNASESVWEDAVTTQPSFKIQGVSIATQKEAHQKARTLFLDEQKMGDLLQHPETVVLPLPDGSMMRVRIALDNILPPALAEKSPSIKTYRVLPNRALISGRLDMNENGFHGMLQMRDGDMIFIDPKTATDTVVNRDTTMSEMQGALLKSIASIESKEYVSYKKHDQTQNHNDHYSCGASHKLEDLKSEIQSSPFYKTLSGFDTEPDVAYKVNTQGSVLNYRIAVAATGEYVAKSGGTVASALSAIATTLSRVNQIYEKDLGIHLTLVENNDLLIYTDAQSDPYFADSAEGVIQQNQNNIDAVIGSANYDIGHLFTTSGGGLAAIGSVCQDSRKAQGVSGVANPFNDSFNVDYVAHEMGHQFGATHTFNGTEGLCAGGTRTSITAFEPGSGSSVMSYAGSCGSDNLQSRSDAMFHIGSIEQIRKYTQVRGGSTCGVRKTQDNQAPVADAGIDYTIPARTPFELKGNALDPDGDTLIYGWEQMDAGLSSSENQDTGNNALFRVYMPNEESQRTFPALNSILTHTAIKGETLPTQDRMLNFKLVVQDGFNASRSDVMQVNVKRTGSRFALEQPRLHYVLGRSHTIKWNVADTNKAPISCDSVNVLLSTDGGYNFSHKLMENIPNTGSASVFLNTTLPEVYQARFKLTCSNNVFFAISYRNFRLTLKDIADAKEVGAEKDLFDKPDSANKKEEKSGGSTDIFLMMFVVLGFLAKKKIYILGR